MKLVPRLTTSLSVYTGCYSLQWSSFRLWRQRFYVGREQLGDVAACSTVRRASFIRAFLITLGQIDLRSWLLPNRATAKVIKKRDWRTLIDQQPSEPRWMAQNYTESLLVPNDVCDPFLQWTTSTRRPTRVFGAPATLGGYQSGDSECRHHLRKGSGFCQEQESKTVALLHGARAGAGIHRRSPVRDVLVSHGGTSWMEFQWGQSVTVPTSGALRALLCVSCSRYWLATHFCYSYCRRRRYKHPWDISRALSTLVTRLVQNTVQQLLFGASPWLPSSRGIQVRPSSQSSRAVSGRRPQNLLAYCLWARATHKTPWRSSPRSFVQLERVLVTILKRGYESYPRFQQLRTLRRKPALSCRFFGKLSMKSTERWALTLIQRLALCKPKLSAYLGDRARPFGMPEKQKSSSQQLFQQNMLQTNLRWSSSAWYVIWFQVAHSHRHVGVPQQEVGVNLVKAAAVLWETPLTHTYWHQEFLQLCLWNVDARFVSIISSTSIQRTFFEDCLRSQWYTVTPGPLLLEAKQAKWATSCQKPLWPQVSAPLPLPSMVTILERQG